MAYPTKKASLTTQTKKHFVVVRKNKALNLDRLKEFLNTYYDEWALIVHEHDKDKVTGETIPIHYHYVGNYNKARTPLSTTINELVKFMKLDGSNGVEIDQYISLEKALQYLVHKNDSNKTPHKADEVMLGGWTKEEYLTFLTADTTGLSFDRVLNICKAYDSIIDIIREIGFDAYHKYRNTIRDIFEEVQFAKKKKETMGIALPF